MQSNNKLTQAKKNSNNSFQLRSQSAQRKLYILTKCFVPRLSSFKALKKYLL